VHERGRRDRSLELAGSFPDTEVVVSSTDASGGTVERRFPIWDDDDFGWGEERDGSREAGWLLALNVHSTTPDARGPAAARRHGWR
jgi:hypothetical protein